MNSPIDLIAHLLHFDNPDFIRLKGPEGDYVDLEILPLTLNSPKRTGLKTHSLYVTRRSKDSPEHNYSQTTYIGSYKQCADIFHQFKIEKTDSDYKVESYKK